MSPHTPAELALRRLAETSPATSPDAPPMLRDLSQAVNCFPFRSAITTDRGRTIAAGDLPPVFAAIALLPGEPFDGANLAEAVADASDAMAAGGTFLILATDAAQRDEVKARIVAALDAMRASTPRGRA